VPAPEHIPVLIDVPARHVAIALQLPTETEQLAVFTEVIVEVPLKVSPDP